ncbi:ribosome biogenesis factor YjgA [Desulfobaculum sp. SPO524]|uniref:ribosome biogenesis factor YjgA n=1 Tax=Desulfobaculum sp. SPO524 TaxID=3378071 RepID=UPI003852ED7C
MPNQHDDMDQPRKSKSQLKREMHELQALGEKLCALPPDVIKRLAIPAELIDAALESKTITAHEGRRRHMQYMGRLVRNTSDVNTLRAALGILEAGHKADTAEFHRIEEWRDALVGGDLDVLEAIIEAHPDADRQRLRQLARNAAKEIAKNKPPKSSRQLFRYLRELEQS